ncbi:MAG: carbohydrate-binding family 9-like protein [Bacteroidota bacterium]|jgi:hypothetical protein
MPSKQLFQQKTSALIGLLLLFGTYLDAQTVLSSSLHSEKMYKARMAKRPIKVDGKLNEHDWKQAVLISDFEDIEGASKPKPSFSTTVKMMWDSQYLYIGAVLEEPHLWGTLKKHDDIIYRDHDFEVFIDPMGDGEQYFEIEINVLGTIMDLFMNKPYKKGGTFDMEWNTTGIQSKVIANGTINNNSDIDSSWTVEMAIPFTAISRNNRIASPSTTNPWRINFSRVQWTLEPDGKSYRKKLNQNNKPISEHNWVWNPTGVIDMHVPVKWGYLLFKN